MQVSEGRVGSAAREHPVRVALVLAVGCLLAILAVWMVLPEPANNGETGPPEESTTSLTVEGMVAFEVPAEGVTISLTADDEVIDTAETAADGSYTVDGEVPLDAETVTVAANDLSVSTVEVAPDEESTQHEVDVDVSALVTDSPSVDSVAGFLMPGNGDDSDPYRITTASDLQAVSAAPHSEYELAGDVAATHTAGWREGTGFAPIQSFTGTLHGGGHAITGLTIDSGANDQVGLFETLAGDVGNLTLANATVVATNGTVGGSDVGGLAGTVETPTDYLGGTSLEIRNVSIVGSVVDASGDEAGDEVAGLVGSIGYAEGVELVDVSVVDTTVDASGPVAGNNIGTIVGYIYSSNGTEIRHGSVVDTTVTALGERGDRDDAANKNNGHLIGGVVGYITKSNSTSLVDITVTGGTVAGQTTVGGLAGYIGQSEDTEIADITVSGTTITAPDGTQIGPFGSEIGGLVGYIGSGNETVQNVSVEDVAISAGGFGISGLIGRLGAVSTEIDGASVSNTTINASARTSGVAGNMVGGIVGALAGGDGVEISDTAVTGSTFVADGGTDGQAGRYIGGIVGHTQASPAMAVSNVSVSATTIETSGGGEPPTGVGGLFGTLERNVELSLTTASVADSTVSAVSDGASGVGGGIGTLDNGSTSVETVQIRNTTVTTDDAGSAVGGFAGQFDNSSAVVSRLPVTGTTVAGADDSAGLVGSVGQVRAGGLTVEQTYVAETTVTGDAPSALLSNHDQVSVQAAYWDVETTVDGDGEPVTAGMGTQLETDELRGPDPAPGFDEGAWTFSSGSYPQLVALG